MPSVSEITQVVAVVPEESAEGVRSGYIIDYISGVEVKATAEEVDAVQVFSRRLVEDLGYTRKQIQTRPQVRVRRAPSDEKKSYPIDIAVFEGARRGDEHLRPSSSARRRTARRAGVSSSST